jgi:hypothetical protein
MRTSLVFAATALSFALCQAIGVAPVQAGSVEAEQIIEGEVIQIDLEQSRVTVRGSDGGLHQFEASAETLKDLKVGDRARHHHGDRLKSPRMRRLTHAIGSSHSSAQSPGAPSST